MRGEQGSFGVDLSPGHAAVQVGADILRFGRGRVVGVAADVEVVVVGCQFLAGDDGGVAGDVGERPVGGDDLLGVLGEQVVLRPPGRELGVGVDEQHLPGPFRRLGARGAQHQDAGGDAGAVEQVGGQADDRLDDVVVQQPGADVAFGAAAEQHPVRHHGGRDPPAALEDRDHVLDEHQVGLLAALGRPAPLEPFRVLHAVAGVVQGERRVGQHPVEPVQLPAVDVHGLGEGVAVLHVGVGDAVQQQVHLRDRPDAAVVLLARQVQVARVPAVLLHVVLGQDQHAARPRARVIHRHARLRLDQFHHHPHHRPRRVELAALLPGGVGELADQVLIRRAEQVGELEVLVAQAVLGEVRDQVPQLAVGDPATGRPAW